MSKNDRLAMLRYSFSRQRAIFAGVLFAANAVSITKTATARQDERDTQQRISTVIRERSQANDDSIADTDAIELPHSRLAVEVDENEGRALSSYLLSGAEQRLLAHSWRRKQKPAMEPVVDPDALPADFTPAPVEDFRPAYTAAELAEADAIAANEAAFEAQVAALPLLLTA